MKQLLFVYNADSGLLNFIADAAHKIFSPATYPCALCALTYTPTGLPRWRRFVKSLPWPVIFLHRDELEERYASTEAVLPAAFLWDGQALQPWIAAEKINDCSSLDDLMTLVDQRAALLKQAENQVVEPS